MSLRCSVCGNSHEGLPHIGVDKPDLWWDVPEDELPKLLCGVVIGKVVIHHV